MVRDADVIVLGAGPAGLAAAWEVAQHGGSVLVLEAEERVGGMAGTVEREGYRFDHGGHRFLTRSPQLLGRVRALLGDDALIVDRQSVILHAGRRIGYPLELADLLRQVPWRHAGRYLGSYLYERLRRPARDEGSFEGWMISRFGTALYREFFEPYTRKLWGLEPRRLSSEWAPQRIGRFDLGVALRAMLPGAPPAPRTYARRFLYPRLGMGQLFEAIAHELERLGGRVLRKAPVSALRLEGSQVRAVSAGGAELTARSFISTLPLPVLLGLLGHASRLRFRALRLLNLMLEEPLGLGSTWAYLSDGRGRVTRVQDPQRRSPWMVPPGRGSLQLEIPLSPDDPLRKLSAPELLDCVRGELEAVGLSLPRRLRDVFAVTLPCAYPVLDLGARAELERGLGQLASHRNLEVCGRQGRFSYIFSDRAMEEGSRAACRTLGIEPAPTPDREETECPLEAASLLG